MYRRSASMPLIHTNTFLQAGLGLVWAAGLSLGLWADAFHGDGLSACVRLSAASAPSWFGCLSVSVLPLLISACAVYFFSFLVFPLCFCRGFILGLGLWAVGDCFGDAGLWMAALLLFGQTASSCALMWFCCRRNLLGRDFFGRDTAVCLLAGFAIAAADMTVISPFLREIMNF